MFFTIALRTFAQTNYYGPDGTEYSIIGSLPGDQLYPAAALNTNGGFVVWQDNITDPTGEGISAMQLNSTLSGSGDIFRVNITTTNSQEHARLALLKNGGAAIVWQGGVEGINQHIYDRILWPTNSSGVTNYIWLNPNATNDALVSTHTNTYQFGPAIARLAGGNLVVVWTSFNQAGSNSLDDVYGQILSTNGTAIGTNFLINQFTTYNQRNPAVAALTNGGFVVAWVSEQERSTAPNWGTNAVYYGAGSAPLPSVDIYARLYTNSASGAGPSTGEFLVDESVNPCAAPAVATASDGSYMITWCADDLADLTNGWDIYERSFTNSTGGSVNLVNSYTYGDQYDPQISVIGRDYLIVWTSLGQDGSREGVFGQFVHEGDGLVGNEFLVNTTTFSSQNEPAIASDGALQYLAVWTSFTVTPNSFDLFAQRYVNTAVDLLPMSAPFVWAPFVVVSNNYQPELIVSWPSVQGLSVSNYFVFVDGTNSPTTATTNTLWTMTAANGLAAASTHSFALEYSDTAGYTSPMSPSTSATTWQDCNYYGIPCQWMEQYYGDNIGSWPSPTAPVVPGGPTLQEIFSTGAVPTNSATWLVTSLTKNSQGMLLGWNSQPGFTYQVQESTNLRTWSNLGAPRFEPGNNDSIFVTNGKVGYYRVQMLWQ